MSSATPLANLTALGGAEPVVVEFELSVDGGEVLFGELRVVNVEGIEASSASSACFEIVETDACPLEAVDVGGDGHGKGGRVGVGRVLSLELLRDLGSRFLAEDLLASNPAVRVDEVDPVGEDGE